MCEEKSKEKEKKRKDLHCAFDCEREGKENPANLEETDGEDDDDETLPEEEDDAVVIWVRELEDCKGGGRAKLPLEEDAEASRAGSTSYMTKSSSGDDRAESNGPTIVCSSSVQFLWFG